MRKRKRKNAGNKRRLIYLNIHRRRLHCSCWDTWTCRVSPVFPALPNTSTGSCLPTPNQFSHFIFAVLLRIRQCGMELCAEIIPIILIKDPMIWIGRKFIAWIQWAAFILSHFHQRLKGFFSFSIPFYALIRGLNYYVKSDKAHWPSEVKSVITGPGNAWVFYSSVSHKSVWRGCGEICSYVSIHVASLCMCSLPFQFPLFQITNFDSQLDEYDPTLGNFPLCFLSQSSSFLKRILFGDKSFSIIDSQSC